MSAAIVHLTIEQGADFEESFQFLDENDEPIDFSDCTARMHIRARLEDETPVVALTTENGRLLVDVPSGTITLLLSAKRTANLSSGGVYDLEVVFPDRVERMLKGKVKLDPEVTR